MANFGRLSDRNLQILELVAGGVSEREAGERFGISACRVNQIVAKYSRTTLKCRKSDFKDRQKFLDAISVKLKGVS